MRRAGYILLALVAIAAVANAQEKRQRLRDRLSPDNVEKMVNEFRDFVHGEAEKAQDRLSNLRERFSGSDEPAAKRKLLTFSQDLQGFLGDMFGSRWQDFVPSSWASPSFDWAHLGEFDYGSNLADFMDAHDLKNLTSIKSMKDLQHTYKAVEDAFCDAESFTPGSKVPASCSGPSVTIAFTPKVCVLEEHTKQVVCDPAKLVLVKSPGSCTHKHHSGSSWVGKECKISGGAGFSDELVIGGGEKVVPLTQFDFEYTP